MAFADTVKFTAGSSGTSDFSDGTALTGFRSLSTGAVSGQTYSYRAFSADLSQWENGQGVYTSGSPGTLTRATVYESSTGSKVNFTAAPVVILTPLKADFDSVAASVPSPQGRLTLTSGSPVLTGDVTAATTIYYTPYVGQAVPIYDGARFITWSVAEVSLVLDATNTVSSKNYDCFVVNDSGTVRLVYGPAWSSDTARGTGAGTTELQRLNGLWTNKNSMTGRYSSGSTVSVAANQGSYVGTFRASASGQTQVKFGSIAVGGGEAWLGIWNQYNRVNAAGRVADSTDSWTYTTKTWRSADNSNTMRVSAVTGAAEEPLTAMYVGLVSNGSSVQCYAGIGYDSTSALSGLSISAHTPASGRQDTWGRYEAADIGFHYMQAIEASDATGTTTWYGDEGQPLFTQLGLAWQARF